MYEESGRDLPKHVLDDYSRALNEQYQRTDPRFSPPLITDKDVAADVGWNAYWDLTQAHLNHEDALKESGPSDPDITTRTQALETPPYMLTPEMEYEDQVGSAASRGEFRHRKLAPEDFKHGDRHYTSVEVDSAMRGRINEHVLGKDVDKVFEDVEKAIGSSAASGLMRAIPEQRPTPPVDPNMN